jgi:flagellar motility protein MotE (MotC chaperone)
MMNRKPFGMDPRTILMLVSLTGAGSLFVSTLTGDATQTYAEEVNAPESGADSEAPVAEAPKNVRKTGCLTDEAAIADVQDQKRDLAKRETELKHREDEISAKERAIADELKKLDVIRDEIKQASALSDSKGEEKVGKLVETFETMSPKAAAAIVATLDERLAVEAMGRVSSAKLGKILGALDPAKSATIAEKIAGVVRANRTTASIDAAETTKRVNGGEENGNLKQQSHNDAVNRQPEPALGREPTSEKR